MAIYGDEFYGLSLYGANTLVDFDVSPFVISSADYNKIRITWSTPTGDWDKIRLVRNGFGFPMTPDDGDLLFEGDTTSNVREYTDQGQVPNNSGLIEGRTYYYTVFVRETTTLSYVAAGNNLGIAVKNYGTADLMYEYLPSIYKVNNAFAAEYNDSEINDDLFSFLQIFAFEHDFFKTMTENIKSRYDPLTLDGRLIPLFLNEFGFAFEQEIGIQQARSLLKNAVKIYSERGSFTGIRTFVTAFSGFNAEISPVINLMLDYNNSTFKESLGFWEVIFTGSSAPELAPATITRGTVATETPLVPPYIEPASPANFPNFSNGFLKAVLDGDGDLLLECGSSAPLTRGIPVNPGTNYVLSAYTRARDFAREVVLNIKWYDRFGQLLGTSGEASSTNVVELWTRTTAATGSAPENSYYAVPQIRFIDCAEDEIQYVDAVQFEIGSEPTTFADARRIDIILRANRINQILNPSFEGSLNNWYFEGGTPEVVLDSAVEGGLYSVKIVADNADDVNAITLGRVDVQGGDQNALSAYVKATAGSTGRLSIVWYDQSEQVIAVSSTSSVSLTLDNWERIEFTAAAPETAVTATISIDFTPGAIGDEVYLDAVMFEKAAFVVPYFDGNSGYAQLGDLIWEGGDATNGRSHYYKNRETVTKRLLAVLPEYLHSGSPWAVFVAQPD